LTGRTPWSPVAACQWAAATGLSRAAGRSAGPGRGTGAEESCVLVLQALFNLTSGSPDRLRAALGLCRSRTWAEAHREELAQAGKAHEFRGAVCPHCQATIDLTSMPSSQQV